MNLQVMEEDGDGDGGRRRAGERTADLEGGRWCWRRAAATMEDGDAGGGQRRRWRRAGMVMEGAGGRARGPRIRKEDDGGRWRR